MAGRECAAHRLQTDAAACADDQQRGHDCLRRRSAFLIFSALAASTSDFSILLAGGPERHALGARQDVEVQMEHHLPAGLLVELLRW